MKDYTGIKSNKLTALSFVKRENKITYWLFGCDCGNQKIIKSNKVFDKDNPTKSCGCLLFTERESSVEITKRLLFRSYIKGAKSRNYSFLLTYDYFINLVSKKCFYCGIEPLREQKHISKSKYSFFCNGIDRKDNSIGYTIENCVPCCKICNVAKSNLSYDVFINWIERLKKH